MDKDMQIFNKEHDSLVEQVDSSLTLIGRFEMSTMRVYQVEKKGQLYLLKGINIERDMDKQGLEVEIDMLERVKEYNNSGITNIVHNYGVQNGYLFMLKEFFPGIDALTAKKDETINFKLKDSPNRNTFFQKMLNTYELLHTAGGAGFDDRLQNYIISPDFNDLCFTDFTDSKIFQFTENVPAEVFETLKEIDNTKLYNKFHDDKKIVPNPNRDYIKNFL